MRVVGMLYVGTNSNDEVMALWDQFMPRMKEVQWDGECYGVLRRWEGMPDGVFAYLACFESNGPVPAGMEAWELKGGEFRITVAPNLDAIKDVFMENLPNDAYEVGGREIYECYPEDFPDNPKVEVLFPI